MFNRILLSAVTLSLAFLLPSHARAEENTPSAKGFSFEVKKGLPPSQVTPIWKDASLQAIEFRVKAGGPAVQRIKVGEGQIVASDLDQEDLPPHWIGTLDFDGDGFQDLYLLVARGSAATHAVLLYDAKAQRFVATKALAEIKGLDISSAAGAPGGKEASRKLADRFGLVTKETMQPPKLFISGPPMKKGDPITVVQPGEPQTVYTAEIDEPILPADEEKGPGYTLKFDTDLPVEEAFVGTAVVGAINGVILSNGKASTRVENGPAGNRLYFRTCTSSEGMHFTVWAGKPLVGARVWHRYHYLGYDVESDCKPKDIAAN